MRYAPGAILVLVIGMAVLASAAEAGQNFTIVLHARTPGGAGNCTVAGLPDCATIAPRTNIAASEYFRMYVFINNYQSVQAMQTGMAWPADWVVDPDGNGVRNCRANQLNLHEPTGAGGSTDGSLITGFDCFNGPQVCLTNAIDFQAGASGCLTQVNPDQGTRLIEMVDCVNTSFRFDASDPLNLPRLGTICIGSAGVNACGPLPVEAATWGRIKASFKR